MPHPRPRFVLPLLLRRLKFSPVVSIQGARQTGKSFLARHILQNSMKRAHYVTLDDHSLHQMAQTVPQSFLAMYEDAHPLIIDEAQKASSLFDSVKFLVDQNRVPGRFLLLGSTEFSIQKNIRESLTGRLSRIRLFPMTFGEMVGDHTNTSSRPTRSQLLKFFKTGGLPGIAFVRDEQTRIDFIKDWIDLTCQRDIHQFPRLKLDGDLAFAILRASAQLPEPTQAAIANTVGAGPKRVATHLTALTDLFVLNRLDPHPSGTGKPIFLPFDVGIAHYLESPLRTQMYVALLNERLALHHYSGKKPISFSYYRSTGKRLIHLVETEMDGSCKALQILDRERIIAPDLELLRAFRAKNPKARLHLLAPTIQSMKIKDVCIDPWEDYFGSSPLRG